MNSQLSILTQLLQELATTKQFDNLSIKSLDTTHSINSTNTFHSLPKRHLKTINQILNEMKTIPDTYKKTLRGCGRFVKREYVERFEQNPFQLISQGCLYTDEETAFVKSAIEKYFEIYKD